MEHFPILPGGQPRFVIGVAVPELGETEAKQRRPIHRSEI